MQNPTCIITGRKDNLLMYAHRNEKGDMVGWVFIHEGIDPFNAEGIKILVNPSDHKAEKTQPVEGEPYDDTKSADDHTRE